MAKFPVLPIINPDQNSDQPRKSQSEKYGGLLYLGIAGLVALILMIAVFGFGVWSMRSVWSDIYILSDAKSSELARVNAAWRLSHDERMSDRQKWDLAMNRSLPPLARYLLAETLGPDATTTDPRGYVLAASRSESWPPWLRMLVARPLAYSAASGRLVDRKALIELSHHPEPFVAHWALFAIAQGGGTEEGVQAREQLQVSAMEGPGPVRSFARQLVDAQELKEPKLSEALDSATLQLRTDEPSARNVWAGWVQNTYGIAKNSASELPVK